MSIFFHRSDLLLAVFGLVWLALAVNVHRPIRPTVGVGTVSFFIGWLTGELAVHHVILQMLTLGWLVMHGALDRWPGWIGLTAIVVSAGALLRYHEGGHRAGLVGATALGELGVDTTALGERVSAASLARPFHFPKRQVVVERSAEVARVGDQVLRADVFHRSDKPANAPVLVYVHGGGWTIGYKQYQGLPILTELAARGWVCVSVSYRLSPMATYPEHVHDVLRGVHWARANAARFGGDPSFLAIAGNSAGAHLSSTAALAGAREPRLRPSELADADLSISACVGIYGVYDFTNRSKHWPGKGVVPFVEKVVLKTTQAKDPDLFRLASPIDLVHEGAPPFLVVHGSRDTLAPVEESRCFVDALRKISQQPVLYAEIEGAQHAFDIFHSVRGRYAVRTIVAFLESRARRVTLEDEASSTLAEIHA